MRGEKGFWADKEIALSEAKRRRWFFRVKKKESKRKFEKEKQRQICGPVEKERKGESVESLLRKLGGLVKRVVWPKKEMNGPLMY